MATGSQKAIGHRNIKFIGMCPTERNLTTPLPWKCIRQIMIRNTETNTPIYVVSFKANARHKEIKKKLFFKFGPWSICVKVFVWKPLPTVPHPEHFRLFRHQCCWYLIRNWTVVAHPAADVIIGKAKTTSARPIRTMLNALCKSICTGNSVAIVMWGEPIFKVCWSFRFVFNIIVIRNAVVDDENR